SSAVSSPYNVQQIFPGSRCNALAISAVAVMVEADLTLRCESPSIVLTRLHGRPYGRPTGGTSGAGGLCVGLCPLPHKEDQCILSNNSSVRHLTAGTALSSPSC